MDVILSIRQRLFEKIKKEMMEFIESYGGLWSLIGLSLTIFTLLGVIFNKKALRRLNQKNFKKNRMPENLDALKEISSEVTKLLVEFEKNKKVIKTLISKLIPTLKSLKKSLDNNETDDFKALYISIKNIDRFRIDNKEINFFERYILRIKPFSENYVDEIDIKLNRLITDIENIRDDNKHNLIN